MTRATQNISLLARAKHNAQNKNSPQGQTARKGQRGFTMSRNTRTSNAAAVNAENTTSNAAENRKARRNTRKAVAKPAPVAEVTSTAPAAAESIDNAVAAYIAPGAPELMPAPVAPVNRVARTVALLNAAPEHAAPIYSPETGLLNLPAVNDLAEYNAAIVAAYEAGFQGINAAAAYKGENAAAVNLAHVVDAVRRMLEHMGKGTGISSLYNIIDGRVCYKVKVARKAANSLGNSRKLAAFIDTAMAYLSKGKGTIQARTGHASGVSFTCDRRQYAVNA